MNVRFAAVLNGRYFWQVICPMNTRYRNLSLINTDSRRLLTPFALIQSSIISHGNLHVSTRWSINRVSHGPRKKTGKQIMRIGVVAFRFFSLVHGLASGRTAPLRSPTALLDKKTACCQTVRFFKQAPVHNSEHLTLWLVDVDTLSMSVRLVFAFFSPMMHACAPIFDKISHFFAYMSLVAQFFILTKTCQFLNLRSAQTKNSLSL
jgi:hypothetical protein